MGEDIYIVKVNGMVFESEAERLEGLFQEVLPGKVVVIDDGIKDVYKLTEQDGQALVRMLAEEVLPEWRGLAPEAEC